MNHDLYTEEFRNIKFLKSHQDLVRHFKKVSASINNVQPWNSEIDPTFKWGGRVEFLEQLFDLRNDTLYIVEPSMTTVKYPSVEEYEDARVHVLEHPVVYTGNPIIDSNIRIASLDDIPDIEDTSKGLSYYISSILAFTNHRSSEENIIRRSIPIKDTPLVITNSKSSYTYLGLFHDEVWAEKYRSAISKFIKDYFSTISTISARL